MGIDLYSTPVSAPARMVLLLAKHLNVDLNVKNIDLLKGEQMKPEFVAINPQHTVPTLVDDGFVVTESRGMLMYLQNKYGKDESLYPQKDTQKRALVDMRIFFDCSMLYPRFGDAYYPVMFGGQPLDQTKVQKVDDTFAILEIFLKDGGFIAGNHLTIADFSMAAVLSTIETCHDISKFPKVVAYLEKCKGMMKGWNELNQVGANEFGQWYKDAVAKQNAWARMAKK